MTLRVGVPERSRGAAGRGSVVEFVGLPGSGKSYLARQVVLAMDRRRAPAWIADARVGSGAHRSARVLRKAIGSGGEVLRHPRRSGRVATRIASSQQHRGDALALAVQWLTTQRLLATARSTPGLHLFEEGVLQTLWSIGLRGRLEPVLAGLDGSTLWPDLVVVVEVPRALAQARLVRRVSRHSRVQHLALDEQVAALGRGDVLLGRLLDWCGNLAWPDVPVVVVPNSRPEPSAHQIDRLADRLVTALRRQPGTGDRAPRGRPARSPRA